MADCNVVNQALPFSLTAACGEFAVIARPIAIGIS